MIEISVVRENLINKEGYSPYCGNYKTCHMPRAKFNGSQFVCPECGWVSGFPEEFIERYKQKWGIK